MPKKIIRLRRVKKSDAPFFFKWWRDEDLIRVTSGIYEKDEGVLKGYFFNMLDSEKNKHYVIEFDSKVVGNISLTHKNKNTFEIHIVIGEKKYWGRGIGAVSIKRILKIAFTKLGYKKACIEVRPDNKRAIGLYEFCGFKKIGLKEYPKNKYQKTVLKMTLAKESE